jgi:hypothetical protein
MHKKRGLAAVEIKPVAYDIVARLLRNLLRQIIHQAHVRISDLATTNADEIMDNHFPLA